jgi:hypothetical protein
MQFLAQYDACFDRRLGEQQSWSRRDIYETLCACPELDPDYLLCIQRFYFSGCRSSQIERSVNKVTAFLVDHIIPLISCYFE